ncbi:MAG TPA: nuclear transport factor 2 family protein [Nitriliruptorales bacterium]
MTELDVIGIERACERLVIAYTHLVDGGEAAAVADLFAPDGVWSFGDERCEGREAIRSAFARRQASDRTSRHVCTNLRVDVVDADHASGVVYVTLYRFDGPGPASPDPVMVGDYRDRFVRTADGWRFDQRHATAVFVRGRSPAGSTPVPVTTSGGSDADR